MTDDLIEQLRCYPANRLCRQVADALEAQARRIAELEADIDRDDEWAKGFIEKTDARIAELEAALKPFADVDVSDCADGHVCYFWGFGENAGKVSAAEVRAARAALEKKE
jgi:hypothetical protein